MTNLQFIDQYFYHMTHHGHIKNVTSKAGSLLVRDNVLYSYGHHFPLAYVETLIVESTPYYRAILNIDKYSRTTSAHQSLCRRVASDYCTVTHLSSQAQIEAMLNEKMKATA